MDKRFEVAIIDEFKKMNITLDRIANALELNDNERGIGRKTNITEVLEFINNQVWDISELLSNKEEKCKE